MSIYKFLIAATLLFISALLVGGLYYPNSFAMIFADTTIAFTGMRAAVVVLLLGLLFTNPPRSLTLRSLVGTASIFLLVLTSYLLLNFQMYMLDAILFLQVAVIFAIEALESRQNVMTLGEKPSIHRKVPVQST